MSSGSGTWKTHFFLGESILFRFVVEINFFFFFFYCTSLQVSILEKYNNNNDGTLYHFLEDGKKSMSQDNAGSEQTGMQISNKRFDTFFPMAIFLSCL